MKRIVTTLFIILFTFHGWSQENSVWLHPNRGQWHPNILYQVDLTGGKMYVESSGFTYHFYETPRKNHGHAEHSESEDQEIYKEHVVKSTFIASSWQNQITEKQPSNFYRNYFLNEDQTKWKSNVNSYQDITLNSFYPGIDLQLNSANDALKYNFIVAPNANTSLIKWKVEGASDIQLDDEGSLIISTTLGTITESKPIAWTIANGIKKKVAINYQLNGNFVSFNLPEHYHSNDTLIIDPFLVFSTYTGAVSDNWGMTATPGPNGETYAGGIVFGPSYPVSTGAIDNSYNGGTTNLNLAGFDVAISKFSENGSQLLYSTFLGGNANELPESMITDTYGNLYVMGITASPNFPMLNSAYQPVFSGGPSATHHSLRFEGTDLYITKINNTGTQLLATTYLGGTSNDGLNGTNLAYNYGDQFRGEILLHDSTVYVVSHTQSANFPKTNGSALTGSQDAIVSRLSEELTTLIWSTFAGGAGVETGNSIAFSQDGRLYITGGTSSTSFAGINYGSYAGDRDGYLLELNTDNGSFIQGTYIGSGGYDQCYFVRTDMDNFVYVYGQSQGGFSITPGKYGNANSGQFIRKYVANLNAIEWTTLIGAGSGYPEISPTAFLISDCYDIFLSGWGGAVNHSGQATHSTSTGFPITPDAYQASTNGSNFYLAILGQDASNLVYGTFVGGLSSSSNHVDGGTSRFDRSGAVYHAVCASCGGLSNGFMSTPGAYSTTNNSANCNLAAFKFQLGLPYSISANSTLCNGGSTQLNATGGVNYTWSPASSLNNPNIANPIATPTVTTVYYVSMDFNEGCAITDSVIVEVINEPIIDLTNTVSICQDESKIITASGGDTYSWSPATYISATNTSSVVVNPPNSQYYYVTAFNQCFDKTDSIWVEVRPLPEIILTNDTLICQGASVILTPIGNMSPSWTPHPTLQSLPNGNANATPLLPSYYYVTGTDEFGCQNTDSVHVSFYPIPTLNTSPDTTVCFGESTQLNASGALSYSWTPTETLLNPTSANPVATPTQNTTYQVNGTYGNNCTVSKNVHVTINYLPVPIVPDTVFACYMEPKTITVAGADSYSWSPSSYLNTVQGNTVNVTVVEDLTYVVSFTNQCGTVYDSIPVVAIRPEIIAWGDTSLCPGQSTNLYASGSLYYEWKPSTTLSNPFTTMVEAKPSTSTMYTVTGTDQYGCQKSDSVYVFMFPQPYISASTDQYLMEGDTVLISGSTPFSGTVFWTPTEHLSCVMCPETAASPPSDQKYIVTIIDENGCTDSDDVWIWFKPLVYVPNTFTPQGDGINELFLVIAGNITTFDWQIFDRWGELIYQSYDVNEGWNGTFKDKICPDGTYTWKLKYKDLRGNEFKHVGHVNLLR